MRRCLFSLFLLHCILFTEAQSSDCDGYFAKGYEFFKMHDFKSCIPYFLLAERCGIKRESIYFSLGRAYLAKAKYDSAIYFLNICDLVYHSDYFWTYGNRGIAYTQMKQYANARIDLDRAIKGYEQQIVHLDADGWVLYRERAWLNIATDRLDDAEIDFSLAIEENPDTVMNYVELCELYNMMGEYQKVLDQEKHVEEYCRDDGHRSVYAFHKLFAKMMLQQSIATDERVLEELLKKPFHIIWEFGEFNRYLKDKKLTEQQKKGLYMWEEKIKVKS